VLSTRIKKLKQCLLNTKPSICVERVRLITEAYKKYSGEPLILLRAKALAYILKNMSIHIYDDELIVGNHASKPRSAPIFPEYGAKWILNEIDSFETRTTDPLLISEEEKKEITELLDYWNGKGLYEIAETEFSVEILEAEESGILTVGNKDCAPGQILPNYPKLLKVGMNGLKRQVEEKLSKISIDNHEAQNKVDFLKAVIIVCDAINDFAKRYSIMAKELSEKTTDIIRQKELQKISDICLNITKNPPQNFHEAIQFLWFIHLVINIESNGHGNSFGRFDQYMYPFYKTDVEKGQIDRQQAIELVQYLWIKLTGLIKLRDAFYSESFAGYPLWQNLIVGGQTTDGLDATNEMSHLVLEATEEIKTSQPSLSLRYHDNLSPELFRKAIKMVQQGMATPAFFNDKLVIPIMLNKGATLEEARDWSIEGCIEPYVPGKTDGRPTVGYVNILKCLELVLNNGKDPANGKQIGLKTGDVTSFNNLNEIMEALKCQTSYFIKLMIEGYNVVGSLHATRIPLPFASMLIDDCIEKAKSIEEGGAKYSFSGAYLTGLANVADSLAAIEKSVFQNKLMNLEELNKILKDNFKNNEKIRQYLLNKAPKYGNDDDFVDGLARECLAFCYDEIKKYTDSRGGKFTLAIESQSLNVSQGKCVGATPDSRFAREPLNDNASPVSGRDINGPTASVRSVAKVDQMKADNGALYNLRFSPQCIKGEKGINILQGIIKTYFDMLGEHIQINVVSTETLLKAQVEPEHYRDLLIRVAGYLAYFTELDKEVQDNIINRTAHMVD